MLDGTCRLGGSSSRLLFANSAWPRASSRVKTVVVLNNSRSADGKVSTREQDDGREKKGTNTHYSSFNIRKERPRDVALAQVCSKGCTFTACSCVARSYVASSCVAFSYVLHQQIMIRGRTFRWKRPKLIEALSKSI
jgi:hypothetical protein